MDKSKELLPLGSVVYLEEGTQKLIIIGRGVIFEDSDSSEQVFADYMGTLYPSGFQKNSNIFFQHENIDRVVFRGYSDEEEKRFLEVYNNWKGTIKVKRAKV
ncbi:MAG: DUF4176 domain-containing protein [Ottowia sp.]|jgi:hypothetical protein|nr:DUF4176 domain-containing protein [uncultured Ottowia sp.]